MKIRVWDWDGIGDDLVGETVIDVEDRWFSKEWKDLHPKPVEMRTLHCPSSSFSQGKLEMWMEVLDSSQMKRHPIINIKPPPPEPYELRVIVWQVCDVTIKDTFTEQNDLYVSGILDVPGIKKQYTDTHLRSKKGFGSFNWRMKYPVQLPQRRPPRFRLAIWDKDFFSADDSICECNLSLAGLFRRAFQKKDRTVMTYRGSDKIWINDLRHPNFEGNQGKIQVTFECMPISIANQLPAGFGRSAPNMNPVLDEPEGREKFSIFHPLRTLRAVLGDRIYFKLMWGFIGTALCSFIMLFGPTLASTFIALKMMGGGQPQPAPAPAPVQNPARRLLDSIANAMLPVD